jgi:hypothetical protein
MAKSVVGVEVNVSSGNSQAVVKELKDQLKQAQQEAKKIADEFGETSTEAINAKEKIKQLGTELIGAQENAKSLKQKFKEAQLEVQTLSEKFGATSDAAIQAAQRAAQLKDAIGDAKALTDAFNPDRKFQAFSGAIQGVVGGFAALQGAQALFGSESEELEKVLVKVQAAMALSQGINSIMEAKDAFNILGTVIKTNVVGAFSSMKAAIASTGIGLLIIGIGLLVEKFMSMSDAAEEAAKAQDKLNESTKKFADIGLKANLSALEREEKLTLARAKAAGQSEDEIFKIQQDYRKKRLEVQTGYYNEIKNADATAAADALNTIKNGIVDGQTAEIEHQTKLKEIRQNAAKEKSNQLRQQNEQNKKEIQDANNTQNDLQKKLQDEITLSLISNERDRAATKLEMDLEDAKKEIENGKATAKEKNESIALLEQQYMINLRQMKDTWAQEDKEKKDKQTEQELEDEKNRQEKFNQLRQEGLQNALKIEEDFANAKQGIRDAELNAVSTGISILGQLGEKNKAIQKVALIAENAVAIARTVIAANQSILETRAKANAIPAFIGPGIPNPSYIAAQLLATKNILSTKINAATSIASIVAATAKGLGALGGGSGGGGGTVGGGGGGGTQANAPLTPQAQTTSLNQGQINQLASATTRAFVLESDVSGNQERIRRINRAARIN